MKVLTGENQINQIQVTEITIDDNLYALIDNAIKDPFRCQVGMPYCWHDKENRYLHYLVYTGGDVWIYWYLYEEQFFPEQGVMITENQVALKALTEKLMDKK